MEDSSLLTLRMVSSKCQLLNNVAAALEWSKVQSYIASKPGCIHVCMYNMVIFIMYLHIYMCVCVLRVGKKMQIHVLIFVLIPPQLIHVIVQK